MSNNEDRTPHETTLISQEFLETIGEMLVRLEMPPRLAVSLFGFFARRIVEHEVEGGLDEGTATMRLMDDFMTGLGLNARVARVDGEEGKLLAAALERAGADTPLQ